MTEINKVILSIFEQGKFYSNIAHFNPNISNDNLFDHLKNINSDKYKDLIFSGFLYIDETNIIHDKTHSFLIYVTESLERLYKDYLRNNKMVSHDTPIIFLYNNNFYIKEISRLIS